jgi:hypothetical protein
MGYTTDFIGHIEVAPHLNPAEQNYLLAFAASRRFDRPGGPYEVPGNPSAERGERPADVDTYNATAPGQPSFWCDWVPCWNGHCLSYDGREKFYGATQWLTYLIDHFLASQAHAQGSEGFAEFTFDHVLDGIVAGCRRDTGELFLIHVEKNVVREQTLLTPSSRYEGLMPYEVAIDEARARRRRPIRDQRRPILPVAPSATLVE